MDQNQKIYTKAKNLRFRSEPSTETGKIIRELGEGQELSFVDGPWLKVRLGDEEGWVHGDYVQENSQDIASVFKKDIPNLAGDATTALVRRDIGDEYGCGKEGAALQCTEYVTYRILTKLGIKIKWPVKSGRNGGKWAEILKGKYNVLQEPKINCAMSFTTGISPDSKINEIGHVAFVEDVYPDGSIKISEANWPRNGIYNERVLSKEKWQNQYKARFVEFS